ncbi:hypothetical protein Poly51_05350 [Rubripirellula tenax]|uniref:Uncharacterized protein n=1 Tax=Rubripirellula tenax TaxID=2528015 RepID=A0A5C6FHA7_9BACT|nr:hypothetical protein [Rubripirellula tenax]TWU60260.1 hypothetical protein Poly51_05350 [Rubripirellula tenax]
MPKIDPFATDALAKLGKPWTDAITEAAMPSLGAGPVDNGLTRLLDTQPLRPRRRASSIDADSASSPNSAGDWSELSDHAFDACRAGLWLLAGDLHRSHSISQDDESPEGSFWHGIMHRREGDFSNAKYWFRRVGDHPVEEDVKQHASGYKGNMFSFVDECKAASKHSDEGVAASCEVTQWIEWQTLMAYCTSV